MAEEKVQPQAQLRPAVSVTLHDIYEGLCPTCRRTLLDLFCQKADPTVLRDALERQLKGKPDGS